MYMLPPPCARSNPRSYLTLIDIVTSSCGTQIFAWRVRCDSTVGRHTRMDPLQPSLTSFPALVLHESCFLLRWALCALLPSSMLTLKLALQVRADVGSQLSDVGSLPLCDRVRQALCASCCGRQRSAQQGLTRASDDRAGASRLQ